MEGGQLVQCHLHGQHLDEQRLADGRVGQPAPGGPHHRAPLHHGHLLRRPPHQIPPEAPPRDPHRHVRRRLHHQGRGGLRPLRARLDGVRLGHRGHQGHHHPADTSGLTRPVVPRPPPLSLPARRRPAALSFLGVRRGGPVFGGPQHELGARRPSVHSRLGGLLPQFCVLPHGGPRGAPDDEHRGQRQAGADLRAERLHAGRRHVTHTGGGHHHHGHRRLLVLGRDAQVEGAGAAEGQDGRGRRRWSDGQEGQVPVSGREGPSVERDGDDHGGEDERIGEGGRL
mmetsp:Transcript_21032/g.60036  ORF Transcript_21032/g.60036 Transcript_21032/m.60036 type:complete len:284 (+) Transcript_21032:425-1276(+)